MNDEEFLSVDSEQELEIGSEDEPVFEEPVFDILTIESVAFQGSGYWDRGLYRLSNGNTAFAPKGLDTGDIAINYNEIRTSGGGYYSPPSGVVGHYYPSNISGGALIFKQLLGIWERYKKSCLHIHISGDRQ